MDQLINFFRMIKYVLQFIFENFPDNTDCLNGNKSPL